MVNQQASELLARHGLRRTPGRISMLAVLLKADHALTQQEILEGLSGTGLNRVSVYRGLHAFTEAGLVHRVEAGDRLWRFGLCDCGNAGHCHPHFTCRECGMVECLSGISLPRPATSLSGYQVEEQEVYMRGLCPKCANQ